MISCSHWGCFELPWTEEDQIWVDELMNNPDNPKPAKQPSWWAGSPAYQHLNFGPYLS